jgi:hypothetical protein
MITITPAVAASIAAAGHPFAITPSEIVADVCACGLPIIQAGGTWYHTDALTAGAIGAARGCRAVLFNVDPDAWGDCRDPGKARPKTPKTRAHEGCTHLAAS